MRPATLLIFNSAVMVTQKIAAIAFSLVTTRLVFAELGKIDYGIFGTIGVTSGLLLVLSDSLTTAATRHMAIDRGAGDDESFARTYNTALGLLGSIGIAVIVLGLALAYPVTAALDIPPEREWATRIVFVTGLSVLAVTTMGTSARSAALASQQHILVAVNDIVKSAARLAAAVALIFLPTDGLITWSVSLLVIEIGMTSVLVSVIAKKVRGGTMNLRLFSREKVRALLGFGGWQMLGSTSWRIRSLGAQVLLNKTFGLGLNSAYALAMQAASFQNTLTASVRQAIAPAVIAGHGGGKADHVRRLVLAASRFVTLSGAAVSIPLALETETLLNLWLGTERVAEVPELIGLARLIAIWMTIETLGGTFNPAMQAVGRIGLYTSITVLIDVLVLVVAGVLIVFFGATPFAVPWCALGGMIVHTAFRVAYVAPKIGLRRRVWLRRALVPTLITAIPAVACGLLVVELLDATIVRVIVTGAAVGLSLAAVGWFTAVEPSERVHLIRIARSVRGRLTGRGRKGSGEDQVSPGSS
ncbi:MAG: hypothetical protein AAGI17_09870 [Planctomycetota bacterium]